MKIIPVIDLKGGVAVRAVGGDRANYVPIGDPVTRLSHRVPAAYVADLDAIAGGPMDRASYRKLRPNADELWVDAGVRAAADALRVRRLGDRVVAGTETVAGPAAWEDVVRCVDAAKLMLSLDLFNGRPLCHASWGVSDAMTLLDRAMEIAAGVRAESVARVIVLDLARVGTGRGPGTERLCERIVSRHPEVELYVGGGVRLPDDLPRLGAIGVTGILSATAYRATPR